MQIGATFSADSRTPIPPRKSITVILAFAAFALLAPARETAASTPVNAGYRDFNFGSTVTHTPTGEKPESKLWFLDGSWWGVLWNRSASSYTIHRFDVGAQDWSNTGTLVDPRPISKCDVLWDGQHLYVASHVFSTSGTSVPASEAARIYRYTYNSTLDTYSLDSGFPVNINSSSSETLVLDKDSTGQLWITWVQGGKVKVNRSLSNDLSWGSPFDLPGQGGSVSSDDISTVISMGNKIGIMWSNQNDKKIYFATHLDVDGDTTWKPREEALADPILGQVADDHINGKPACGPDGTLYFVTKTNLNSPPNPLNYVLKRTPTGTWTHHVCGIVSENHTRSIILLNPETSTLYVFAMSDVSGREIIYVKSASTSNLVFPSGLGTPFIDSSTDLRVNDATSTKQCVSGATGILVLAGDEVSHNYLHNYLSLGGLVPAITAFNPSAAPVGTQITITGAGFTGATSVQFNGLDAAGYIVDLDSQIRATVPSGATTGQISVTTSNGTGTSVDAFVVTEASTPVNAGYRDFDFGPSVAGTPTAEKPESKLWFLDGSWWGVLWNTSANSFTIHRFNVATQDWTNTGTLVDSRTNSKCDVLWDGQHLYVASHEFSLSGTHVDASQGARIYRFSYNSTLDTYTLDSGFPVNINSSSTETLVLDKDSTGRLWITWVEGGKVKVNRSQGSDQSWGGPFNLPVQGNTVSSDDISTVISMGNKIGIMWTNQNDQKIYFATHLDGNGDNTWQPREEALSDPVLGQMADDHINAKAACGPDGTLYFVAKTGLSTLSQPLNYVLKRTSTGIWSRHVCGTVAEGATRAIVLLDSDTNTLYVFSMSNVSGREIIYVKSASTSDLVFPSGLGTPFIDSSTDQTNNPTSTKQCVSGGTGLLVLASDAASHFYLHNYLSLGGLVPNITAFNPSSAPVGTQITITGARFTGATSVKFNGLNAAGFIVDSNNQIRATVPSGATTGKITVTTSNGTGTSADDFVVVAPPTVAGFTPVSGPVGTVVTVTGTAFASATGVTFGGVPGTFTIDSDTQIHATVPGGAVTGTIQVTNPAGSAQSAASFTVTSLSQLTLNPTDDARVVSSSPTQTGGTQTVLRVGGSPTIYHSYFKFNVVGLGGAIQSAKLRLFCNDASVNGGRIVAVSNNYLGTSTPWVESGLNWNNAPALTGATLEQKGSVALGTWVEFDVTPAINGDGTYSFGMESASTNIAGYDSKETTNLPQLVIQAGTAAPPSISSFTPASGPVGTVVTIQGSSFTSTTAVKFNGMSATFTIDSDVQIHATVPSGATSGLITVTNSTGTATSASSFTVLLPPTIASFSPATGPAGTVVTVQGSSFATATAVQFNGTSATFTTDSDVQIRATVPAGVTSGPISVTNPQGTGTSAATYFPNPPTISSFSPSSGPVGTLVTISGAEFVGVTGVTFNGLAATFTIDSNVQILATVPTGATSGLIQVTNPAGTATSDSSFTVTIAPSIASFTPSSGPVGTLVTISGSAFTGATAVTFNGTAASSFTVDSDVQIRATVPSGAGSGPIAVTAAGGTGTSAASFVVISPPVVSGFTPTSGPVGTVVTITGGGFTGATVVTFNGTQSTFTIDSDAQISATVPSGATTGLIQVTNPAGSAQSASPFNVTVQSQLTLNPTDDARVVSSSPTQTGGATTVLRVGGSTSNYHTYLKFNVSGLSGSVQSAKLRLFCNDASVNGGRIVAVDNTYLGTSTPWVESGLNWNNAPALTGTTLDQKASVAIGEWVEFNVTAAVTGNGIYSFGMDSPSSNICGYDSKEGLNHPQLVIQLLNLPPSVTVASFTVVGGSTGSTAVSATDPDGDLITLTASLPGFATLNAPTSGTGSVTTSVTASPSISDTGSYPSSVTATAGALSDTENFTITVRTDQAPVLAPISDLSVAEGSADSTAVSATDPDGDTVTLTASLPSFASLSATSGTGTVATHVVASPGFTDAGSYPSSVTATAGALSDTENFTVTVTGGVVSVLPTVETDPAHHSGDNADDTCIWIHPTDASLSLVIGDDKSGGLMVYGLDGKEVQYVDGTNYDNVDLRYNFPLSGQFGDGTPHQRVALVGVGDETNLQIDFFKVNPGTRRLEAAGSVATANGLVPYGGCMYHSPSSGKYYYIVNAQSGVTQQWELRDDGAGTVAGTLVREFDVGSRVEGCVADDVLAKFYIGEEAVGVWKYGAEPGDGSTRTQVDHTGTGGHLTEDVEGMSIYYRADGGGYLLVSNQGSSTIGIYAREGANAYVGVFNIVANGTIDAVTSTDGLDVTNFPLGSSFSSGLFVAHDTSNSGGTSSNHKYVPWQSIAAAFGLTSDTSWDPRQIGASDTTPPAAATLETNSAATPSRFALGRIHPNPLRHRASIRFELPRSAGVTLRVYDVTGRLVRTLAHGDYPAGVHEVSWDALDDSGRRVGSGVYWTELRTQGFRSTRKLLLQR